MTSRVPAAHRTASDDAELGSVDSALNRLTRALERFLRDNRSPSFPAYPTGAVPSEPDSLPTAGVGLDATLDELGLAAEWGCRVSAPGFVGFITTGATTSGDTAHTAVAVQRLPSA